MKSRSAFHCCERAALETGFTSGVVMGTRVMSVWVVSARMVGSGVMSGVAMMLVGGKGRGGKHHQEEHGGKYLLHGTNLTRYSRR
jgi:hypothetical protein